MRYGDQKLWRRLIPLTLFSTFVSEWASKSVSQWENERVKKLLLERLSPQKKFVTSILDASIFLEFYTFKVSIGIQNASIGTQSASIGIHNVSIGFLWMSVYTQNSKLTRMKCQLTPTKCKILRNERPQNANV